MKKFIKNNLAVILSFAIVLTTILPVLGGLFVSANEAEIAAAVETLKTEWGKLQVYKNEGTLLPNRWFGSAGKQDTSVAAKLATSYSETLPENVIMGNKYMDITLAGAGDMSANKQIILFESGITTINGSAIKDIVFWVKPTIVGATDITFKFRVQGGGLYQPEALFTVPVSKSGQWTKVSLKETIGAENYETAFKNRNAQLTRYDVGISGNNGDTIVVGSPVLVVDATLPTETEQWSGGEWLAAANAVTGIANDDTAWRAAIVALKSVLGGDIQKDIALTEFKKAWANLGTVVKSPLRTQNYYFEGSPTADIGKVASAYTGELPDNINLGSHYAEVTLTDADIDVSGRSQQLFLSGNSANLTGDIENIYFWVKPTFAGEENISFKVSVTYSSQNTYINPVVIPASKNEQWIKISLDELAGGEWKANLATAASRKVMRLELTFTGNNGDKILVGSAFEVTAEPRELPAGSGSWTIDEWVIAASELDLTGALNVDAFNVALEELSKYANASVDALKAIAKLKTAWKQLNTYENSNLAVGRYFLNNASSGYISKVASTYAGELPDGVLLGKSYGEITLAGAGEITNNANGTKSHQVVLLEGDGGATNIVSAVADMAVWIKPTFAGTEDITVKVALVFSDRYIYPTEVTIPASKSGEWIKISLDELDGSEWWSTLVPTAASVNLKRLDLCFSGNEGDKVVVGSALEALMAEKELPAGSDSWGVDEWVEAADALDLSNAVNTEAFNTALNELYAFASISREEKIAIKNLKNAWSKMIFVTSDSLGVKRFFDIDGTQKGDIGKFPINYTGELPEGVNLGHKYGEITLQGEGAFDGSHQVVLFDSAITKDTIGDINDVAFWVKANFAGEKDITAKFFFTTQNPFGQIPVFEQQITIPAEKNGEWVKISFNEVIGGSYKASVPATAMTRNIGDFRVCLSGNVGDTLLIGGCLTYVKSKLPENTDGWNVADWLYATSTIDTKYCENTEAFIEAKAYAEDVRDRLLIARSCEKFDFATMEDAENGIDENIVTHINMLEGVMADVSVYDGVTATPVTENETIANLTDADDKSSFNMDGLAGNGDTFVDFAFDVQGLAEVNQILMINDGTLLADKYYIYVGDSRSKLFQAKNLVATHTLVEGNAVQFFNFAANSIPEGKFIGLRVYTDAQTLTIPEIAAYGPVTIYSVEKGTFDNGQVAALGKNLLKGIEPRFRTSTSQKHTWTMFKSQFSDKSQIEFLTDGDVETGIGYYQQPVESADDKTTLHIFYDLGDTYTIEKLHLQHINLANYQTGEYEIYASPDLASLFSQKSKILTYDNRVNGPNGTSTSQVLTLNKQINARYVSFCIKFPVSDYEKLISGTNQGIGIRIMELGVYGPRYYKPYALVNLGARTSLTVTRTDATGKSTKLNDGEYDGTEHKFTYDGKTDTYASVGMAEGEKLELFYDLAADQVINKLQIKTNAGTIKQMKVYASDKLEDMYKSTSMVFNYNAAVEDMGNEVFVDFTESPRNMRYVRFVIEDIEGEVFEPSEIEIIGGNDQEFFYNNLAEGKSDTAAFFTTDKNGTVAISEHANKWKFGHTTWSVMYHSGNALDNDPDTVFDFYGGKNGEESLNMLIDMGTLNSIDNIQILGGSSEQYWPDEINFYFSTDDLDLYTEKAVPAKKWTSKSQDGVYSFDFVPQIAQYVRVEILRSDDTIYSAAEYGDKIATVLSEIQVNGLEARGRVVNGVVASFTDEETGITVDINALRENDVYTTVQDILVKKRAATADEKASIANENNMKFVSDVYEIYLLDLNDKIVTDFDGRTITYRIPQNLTKQTEDVYLLNGGWGGFNMVEFEILNGYYCAVFDDATFSTFALGAYAEIELEDEEPENIFGDEEEGEEIEEDEEEDDKPKKKKKIKVIRKNNNENGYLWIILASAAGLVVIAAGVILFIVLKKKKNKEDEE